MRCSNRPEDGADAPISKEKKKRRLTEELESGATMCSSEHAHRCRRRYWHSCGWDREETVGPEDWKDAKTKCTAAASPACAQIRCKTWLLLWSARACETTPGWFYRHRRCTATDFLACSQTQYTWNLLKISNIHSGVTPEDRSEIRCFSAPRNVLGNKDQHILLWQKLTCEPRLQYAECGTADGRSEGIRHIAPKGPLLRSEGNHQKSP